MKRHAVILFFDTDCLFCSKAARMLKKLDARNRFVFDTVYSDKLNKLCRHYRVKKLPDSIVVYVDNKLLFKSSAIFKIIDTLGGGYKLLMVFRIFPKKILDKLYDFIAQNRKKLIFAQSCRIHN